MLIWEQESRGHNHRQGVWLYIYIITIKYIVYASICMDTRKKNWIFLDTSSCRFFLLRYEDLSLDSSSVIKDLWKKLNLPLSTTFLEYLNNTTNGNKPKGQLIDSTRDTFKHTFQWRDQIKWSFVDEVQTVCAGLIRAMGWREFSKESDLRNASYSINIVEWDIWMSE